MRKDRARRVARERQAERDRDLLTRNHPSGTLVSVWLVELWELNKLYKAERMERARQGLSKPPTPAHLR